VERNWAVCVVLGPMGAERTSHPMGEEAARALYLDLHELAERRPGTVGRILLIRLRATGRALVDSVCVA
jgi:hypothetical protein